MTAIGSIASLTLDLPPSCIQFSPRHPGFFVVGTYYLHGKEQQGDLATKSTQPPSGASGDNDGSPSDNTTESSPAQAQAQKRTGSLLLFKLENDQITRLSSTATDFAILDIQWAVRSDTLGDLLAVATSTGLLAFYQLRTAADTTELVSFSVHAITQPEILVLSLTWHPSHPHVLGFTLSDGSVQLCECDSKQGELWAQNAVLRTTEIHSHELEAWTLAFAPGEAEVVKVVSGGDDVALQCSHIGDTDTQEPAALLWRDRKLHEAGVTAILPVSESLIVTGSYDDYIRLISTPSVGRRQVLAEMNLGGGVWRLKVLQRSSTAGVGEAEDTKGVKGVADPHDPAQASSSYSSALSAVPTNIVLLCSCMHAGTRIVKLVRGSDGVWSFERLAKFEEHGSMNYGSDVQCGTRLVVSTSFYDKLMCLWRIGEDVM